MSYFIWIVSIVILGVLFWLIDPLMIGERLFNAKLRRREPFADDDLALKYFATDSEAAKVAIQVRNIFAKHMGYPAEKLLPGDDLAVFWSDLEMIELIREIEAQFNIKINDADAEHTQCTIRSVVSLIGDKLDRAGKLSSQDTAS